MRGMDLYDYIIREFNLDGTSCRLVHNIIEYVRTEYRVDEDAYVHLMSLLDGAFGIEAHEVKQFFTFEED